MGIINHSIVQTEAMADIKTLEKQIEECKVNGQFRKTDIKGKKYCTFLLPEDLNKKLDCPYKGIIADFHKKDSFGLPYPISYYSCNKKR